MYQGNNGDTNTCIRRSRWHLDEQIKTFFVLSQLLITAIRKNYQEEIFNQFASQLLIMTLGFLTRMIKTQALLEEHVELRQMSPEVEETGGTINLKIECML